jgi:hypothetical protein
MIRDFLSLKRHENLCCHTTCIAGLRWAIIQQLKEIGLQPDESSSHSLWCASCCVYFTKRIWFEAVYTTISSENKQDRHYRVNICFNLLLISSLHVSTLTWVILRRTWILGVRFLSYVIYSLWFHIVSILLDHPNNTFWYLKHLKLDTKIILNR